MKSSQALHQKTILGILFFICLGAPSSLALEAVLQYSLIETRTPTPSAEQIKKKEKEIRLTSKKKVVLGEDFFSVKEGQQERIYDFRKRRIHYLDHHAKKRTEISLFADPAFRINEFQHRVRMDEVVVKAGGQPLEDLFVLESIFGVESESQRARLSEDVSEKGKTKLLNQGKSIAEITWSEKYSIPEKSIFARFLVYDNTLHPQILKRIIENIQFPAEIRSWLLGPEATDQLTLTLDDLKIRPNQGFKIPNYPPSKKTPGAAPSAGSLAKLIQSVQAKKNKISKHDKEWFLKHAQQAEKSKNYLDAALSVLEYGLQTGDQKTSAEEMQKLAVHQKDDPEIDRFFRSLGIAGPEQAKRAILELGKINRKKLSRAHVIDIMIANQQSVLGQNGDAQKRMISALKMNPYITGAYKDLGDMFYADFDMASAWMCWDFARQQTPDHFMLKPISDYEADLLKNSPYFF